jgi:hypothetical protein
MLCAVVQCTINLRTEFGKLFLVRTLPDFFSLRALKTCMRDVIALPCYYSLRRCKLQGVFIASLRRGQATHGEAAVGSVSPWEWVAQGQWAHIVLLTRILKLQFHIVRF